MRAPDQRLLKGAPATLRVELADQNGEVDTSVDAGVTVTVTRLDGTALVTAQAATSIEDGVATYDLTAAQTGAGLDLLTAAWTHNAAVRATTYHEIVGRHWFPASALREISGVADAQGSPPGETSDQALIEARTWVESLIEHFTCVAWVPRTTSERHTIAGCTTELVLGEWYGRTLRSLSLDDVDQDVDEFTLTPRRTLQRIDRGAICSSRVNGAVVRYDYGADAPPPPLLQAAIEAAADRITSRASTLGNRLTGTSGQFGTISYASIDKNHPTGIPAVDEQIRTYRRRRLRIND